MANVLRDQPSYSLLCALAGALLILTGIANMFIIKAGKAKSHQTKTWAHFLAIKFVLSLGLTPAFRPIQCHFELNDEKRAEVQFWIVVVILVMSVGIKGYREDVANNFEPNPFEGKFREFQKRFEEVTSSGKQVNVEPADIDKPGKDEIFEALRRSTTKED